jgi:hypothetical protein
MTHTIEISDLTGTTEQILASSTERGGKKLVLRTTIIFGSPHFFTTFVLYLGGKEHGEYNTVEQAVENYNAW